MPVLFLNTTLQNSTGKQGLLYCRPFCAKCMPWNLVKNPFSSYMFFTYVYDKLGNVYTTAETVL